MASQSVKALRKYGAGTSIYFAIVKSGTQNFAVAADWTPAGADSNVWKDGGAVNPTSNVVQIVSNALWKLDLTAGEMSAAAVNVHIIDAAGGPNIDPLEIRIETYGNASAEHAADLDDSTRLGLSSLPSSAPGSAGGLPTMVTSGSMAPTSIATGVANAGDTVSQITLTGGSATNNIYNGALVSIVSGTGAGQARRVVSYTGATKVALLDADWITAPDGASIWVVAFDRAPDADSIGNVGVGVGGILATSFAGSAIDSTAIANGAITNAKLAANAIDSAVIAAGAITATKFAANAIDAAAIATGAITAAKFAAGAIDAAALAADAGAEIADAVWDEPIAGHLGIGTTGAILNAATPAGVADAVWDEARAGHVAGGSFGEGVAVAVVNTNTLTALSLAADAANEIADAVLARSVPEAVAAVGVVPTVAQALTAIHARVGNKDRAGNVIRHYAVDGTTQLEAFTTDDIDDPVTHNRTA